MCVGLDSVLVVTQTRRQVLEIRLDSGPTSIGRCSSNDVILPDDKLSDVAVVIFAGPKRTYWLQDLSGGQLYWQKKLNSIDEDSNEYSFEHGEIFTLGEYTFELVVREVVGGQVDRKTQTLTLKNNGKLLPLTLIYKNKRINVSTRQYCIGSHPDNDLIVDDAHCSSFHCRIVASKDSWFVYDLGSTNGTYLNDIHIDSAELPNNARLRLGQSNLILQCQPNEQKFSQISRFKGMITRNAKMRAMFESIQKFADTKDSVLIQGESGTGKELVARALHDASGRVKGPYLVLNCGALSPTVIESELFGYVRGAFTGAVSDRKGAFEAATGGTLFLDEIGEMPLELQPKLLRVLESSTIRKVGGVKEVPVDVRIVAATHRSLEKLVREGSFRQDLFFRLFVLGLSILPLRKRPEDILPLSLFFANQSGRSFSFSQEAQNALLDYRWPGNVRELRNAIRRAILLADSEVIEAEHLLFSDFSFAEPAKTSSRRTNKTNNSRRLNDDQVRAETLDAYQYCEGNQSQAAKRLGISKSTMSNRLRRYGII